MPESRSIESILSQEVQVGPYRVRYGVVTTAEGRCFGVAYRRDNAMPDVPWRTPTSRDFLADLRSVVTIPNGVKFPSDPSPLPSLLGLT